MLFISRLFLAGVTIALRALTSRHPTSHSRVKTHKPTCLSPGPTRPPRLCTLLSCCGHQECRGLPAFATVAERRAAKAKRRAKAAARDADLANTDSSPSAAAEGVGRQKRPGEATKPAAGASTRRPRSRSWADDSSGSSRGSGGFAKLPAEVGGVGAPAIDPWKIRVARIRQQVEFCVERGWIARGNRPGTYTLPKPPPRYGPSSGDGGAREENDFGPSDQGGVPAGGGDGGPREAAGLSVDAAPTAEASAPRRGRGATGSTGTLWVGEDTGGRGRGGGRARGGGGGTGGGGGVGGNGGSGNAARPPGRQPRVPLVPPGQQRDYLLTAAAAEAAAEAAAAAEAGRVAPSASLSPRLRASGGPAAQPPLASSLPSPLTPPPAPREQQQLLAGGSTAAADADANEVAKALHSLNLGETPPPQEAALGVAAGLRSPPGIEPGLLPVAGGAQRYHPFGQASSGNGVVPGGRGGIGEAEAVAAAAAAAAAAGTADLSGNDLPESVLGVVLAGLGSSDGEGNLLCEYCCATLDTTASACGVCGTPAAVAGGADGAAGVGATAAGAAEAIPACRWRAYYMAEDGRPYYSDGASSVWVKPKELEEYEAAVAAAAAAAAAGPTPREGQLAGTEPYDLADRPILPPAPSAAANVVPVTADGGVEGGKATAAAAAAGLEMAAGGPAAGSALPAGVLAVGDLAEVRACSRARRLPGMVRFFVVSSTSLGPLRSGN